MKIHSDTAWNIASQYSYTLASDTRTLAAQIDVALADKDAEIKCLREALEGIAAKKPVTSKEWNAADCWYNRGQNDCQCIARAALKGDQP